MKAWNELKNLGNAELKSKLLECKKELLKLRVQAATGSNANPGKLKKTKKSIARILALMHKTEVKLE